MREPVWVSRDQLLKCLRDAGWGFKAKKKRVEVWKRSGSTDRIVIALRKTHSEDYVRVVLSQAGLTAQAIEDFLRHCVTSDRS